MSKAADVRVFTFPSRYELRLALDGYIPSRTVSYGTGQPVPLRETGYRVIRSDAEEVELVSPSGKRLTLRVTRSAEIRTEEVNGNRGGTYPGTQEGFPFIYPVSGGAPAGGRPKIFRDDAERQREGRERRKLAAENPERKPPGPERKYRDNAAKQRAYRLRKRRP